MKAKKQQIKIEKIKCSKFRRYMGEVVEALLRGDTIFIIQRFDRATMVLESSNEDFHKQKPLDKKIIVTQTTEFRKRLAFYFRQVIKESKTVCVTHYDRCRFTATPVTTEILKQYDRAQRNKL